MGGTALAGQRIIMHHSRACCCSGVLFLSLTISVSDLDVPLVPDPLRSQGSIVLRTAGIEQRGGDFLLQLTVHGDSHLYTPANCYCQRRGLPHMRGLISPDATPAVPPAQPRPLLPATHVPCLSTWFYRDALGVLEVCLIRLPETLLGLFRTGLLIMLFPNGSGIANVSTPLPHDYCSTNSPC